MNILTYDVVILGHFARDKLIIDGEEKDALGGAVYYGAMALSKLNYSAAIITLLSKDDFFYLDVMRKDGIEVFAYEAEMTSGIKNTYFGENNDERVCNPIYATAIGLLLKGIENPHNIDLREKEEIVEEPESIEEESGKWYEQLFHKTKEWFETEPDSEF